MRHFCRQKVLRCPKTILSVRLYIAVLPDSYGECGEAYEAWRKKSPTLGEELADVAIYLLGIAEICNIDLGAEIERKMEINERRQYKIVDGVNTRIGEKTMELKQYENKEYRVFFENNAAVLPQEALDTLGCTDVVIMIGIGRSLRILTKNEYAELQKRFDNLGPHERARLRAFFSTAEECSMEDGRMTVSDQLLAYANITGRAKLTFGSGKGTLTDDTEGCHLRAELAETETDQGDCR